MFRSRGKSPSRSPETPTPTSISTPTHPGEPFLQKKFPALRRGDVKTLAVSSIAVASSIGSPSLNQAYTPHPDEQKATHTSHLDCDAIGQESNSHWTADSAWQTAYSTAKMAVDIAKESSDMFLPLKAVVGALSVLIKNYDQTVSNARQVEEIEERVLSFSDILRFPLREGDKAESARRELLCKRLMDVLERMEPLSEQKGLLKFLRNQDHAGLLNGFVQDIARAVTDYQTSLQQSTYENTKDIHEVAKETHNVSRNIDKATKGIAENAADIVHKAKEIIEAVDLETLDKLDPVRNAGYQAEHHERCLSGTRESILGDIMRWAQNIQDQPVYWLNGLAGTGKSTIPQTFSEMASSRDILGASFFCSREYLGRKVLKNIFPTLAYQLACRYPQFRDHLVNVIKQDPSVAHNSLISQLRDLLVDPLSATGISCVIVIDALDECVDDQPASAILSVLGRLVNKLPLVKFFITGRPEPRIRSGFRLPLLEPFTQVFLLHEVEPTSVGGDIRLYLTEKLAAIAKRRSGLELPEVWPSDEDIMALVKKSSGLFIFASTVARFIGSEFDEPGERLQLIVNKADDTSHEGASGIDSLYSQVLHDAVSGIKKDSVFADLKRILSAVVLALDPLSRDGLVQLLNIDSAVIYTRLRHLHSVILVPEDRAKEIRVFHKSFPDFLQDPNRCRDPRLHIDCPTRHGDMALCCLHLVGKLKINPCGLPPFVMNEDVSDREQLLMEKLGSGLRYACKHWSTHLISSSSSREYDDQLMTPISTFFDRAVFPWMEVMSLEGHLEGVVHSMSRVSNRSYQVHPARLKDIDNSINDCLRFTLNFFRPIQLSAQHIYHTALPLSPEPFISRLWLLSNYLTTRQASSSSTLTTWGPIFRTIKAYSGSFTHMTVAGERIVAVSGDNTVNVYDAVTGVLRLSLNSPQQVTKAESSPDGSVLFFAHQRACEITVWDTQTGGSIDTLTAMSDISDIAVSSKGRYLGSCSSDGASKFWEVEGGCEPLHPFDQAVACICWLEPEDQVALAVEGFIVILEVTTGRTLHTCFVGGSLRRIAFSAHQHNLAILSVQEAEGTIGTMDIKTGSFLASPHTLHNASSLALKKGGQVVCATNDGNLLSYDPMISFDWEHHLTHLGTIHSMGLLKGGNLVVSSGESILLLGSKRTILSGASQGPGIARAYQLGNDKAFCTSKEFENINLLDMETMKILANHRIKFSEVDVSSTPRLLCTSIGGDTIVLCLRKHDGFAVMLYKIGRTYPMWEQLSWRPVLLGALSPSGSYLITVSGIEDPSGGGDWELCVREAGSNGNVLNNIPFIRNSGRPSKIGFTSDDQFYTEERRVRKVFFLTGIWLPDQTPGFRIEIEGVPGEGILPVCPYWYSLDENLEWVLDTKSRRVCCLPPGYVTGIEDGHFFVDSSIVTAGQDGVVRKLTFIKPRSDS